eukprot:1704423-Prorocentrum_lima.AAC.1
MWDLASVLAGDYTRRRIGMLQPALATPRCRMPRAHPLSRAPAYTHAAAMVVRQATIHPGNNAN